MIFSDFPENKYVNPEAVEKKCEKYDEEDLDICEVLFYHQHDFLKGAEKISIFKEYLSICEIEGRAIKEKEAKDMHLQRVQDMSIGLEKKMSKVNVKIDLLGKMIFDLSSEGIGSTNLSTKEIVAAFIVLLEAIHFSDNEKRNETDIFNMKGMTSQNIALFINELTGGKFSGDVIENSSFYDCLVLK